MLILIDVYGYEYSDVRLLTDGEGIPDSDRPTCENIVRFAPFRGYMRLTCSLPSVASNARSSQRCGGR